MVKNKEQTEDILQDVYIRVLKSYQKFKGNSSERTWLFSIARHVTFDYFRSLKRKRQRIKEFFNWGAEGEMIKANEPLPEEVTILDEQMKLLYRLLDQCNWDQKHVIILRYLQDFNIKETADILGWSISKVKTTQHRALKLLKALMEDAREKEDVDHENKSF